MGTNHFHSIIQCVLSFLFWIAASLGPGSYPRSTGPSSCSLGISSSSFLLVLLGRSPSFSPVLLPAILPATLASWWRLLLFPMEDQGVLPSISCCFIKGCFLILQDMVVECFLCTDFKYVMRVGGGCGASGSAVQ